MDDQAGAYGQGRIIPSSGLTGELGGSVEEQLARAQERLSFYESFDGLIQENISRSGELLRQAMDMRESAIQEIALARQQTARTLADAEHRVDAERDQQRAALGSLRDELNQLQQHAAGLVGRVSDALTEIDARGAPTGIVGDATPAPMPDAEPPAIAAPVADAPFDVESPSAEAFATGAEQANGTAPAFDAGDPAAAASLPELDVTEPVEEESAPVEFPTADFAFPDFPTTELATAETEAASESDSAAASAPPLEWQSGAYGGTGFLDGAALADQPAADAPAEPAPAASDPTTSLDPSIPRPIMVLVHGVPRAAAALSLQRHLAGLGHVDAVEAREYAEGVLRLQVVSRGPLQLDDIRRWEGGINLEPVHVLDDVIEIKLPGAAGF